MIDPPIHTRVLSVVSASRRGYRPLCRCYELAERTLFQLWELAFAVAWVHKQFLSTNCKIGTFTVFCTSRMVWTVEVLGKREGVVHRLAKLKTLPAYSQLPRRQGSRVPSPSRTGVFGALPRCKNPRCFESTFFRSRGQLGRSLFGICQPGVRVGPFFARPVLGSPPFCSAHRCPVAGGH